MSDIDYRIKYHKYKSKYDNLIMQGGAAAAEEQRTYYDSDKKVESGDIVYCNELSIFGSVEAKETFPWHGIVLSNQAVEMVKNHLTKGNSPKQAAAAVVRKAKAAAVKAWTKAAGKNRLDADTDTLIKTLESPVIAIGDVDRFYHLTEGMSREEKEELRKEIPHRGDLVKPRTEYLATTPRENIVACIQGFDLRSNSLVLLGRKLHYRADLIVKANEKIEQEEFKLYRRPFQGEPAVKYPNFESPQFPGAKKIVNSGLQRQLFVTRQHAAQIVAEQGQITWALVLQQALMPTWDGPRYGGPGEHLEVGSIVEKITDKNGGAVGTLGQVIRIERRDVGRNRIPPYRDIGMPVVLRQRGQGEFKIFLYDPDDYKVINPTSKEALEFIAAVNADVEGDHKLIDIPEQAELLFTFTKRETLGLKLVPISGDKAAAGGGISLTEINKGTQAEDFLTKGLTPGLQLNSIGGQDITQLSYNDVLALLKDPTRPKILGFINSPAAMQAHEAYQQKIKKQRPPQPSTEDVMAQARAAKLAQTAPAAAAAAARQSPNPVPVPLPQVQQRQEPPQPAAAAAHPHEQHIEQELGRFKTEFEQKLGNEVERVSDELRREVQQMQAKMNREIAQVSRKVDSVSQDLRKQIGQVDASRSEDLTIMKARLDELNAGMKEQIALTSSHLQEQIQSLQIQIQSRTHDTSGFEEEPAGVRTTGYRDTTSSAEQKSSDHFARKAKKHAAEPKPHEMAVAELHQRTDRILPGQQQQTKTHHINITAEGEKYLEALTVAHEERLQEMQSKHEQELVAHTETRGTGSPYDRLVTDHESQIQALLDEHAKNVAEIQDSFPQEESEQEERVSKFEGHFAMKAKRLAAGQEPHELTGTEHHELYQRKSRTLPRQTEPQAVELSDNPHIHEFLGNIARPAEHQQQIDGLVSHHQKKLRALQDRLTREEASPTRTSTELEAMKEQHRSEMEETHNELDRELREQVHRAQSEQVTKMYDHNQRALESLQEEHKQIIKKLQTRPDGSYDRDYNVTLARQHAARHKEEIRLIEERNTEDVDRTSFQMSQLGEEYLARETDKVEASGTGTIYTATQEPRQTQTHTQTHAQAHAHFAAKKARAQAQAEASGERAPTGLTRPTRTLAQQPLTELEASGERAPTRPTGLTRTLAQQPQIEASGEQATTRTLGQQSPREPEPS
tara:strand:+ start:1428 stop:4988 length:3561 start_codon:yes stop_codon:yes gene_type:complete